MQRILPGKNVNTLWMAMNNCVLATLVRNLEFLKMVRVSMELRDVVYVDAGRVTQRDRGAPPRKVRTTNRKFEMRSMEDSLMENAPVS